MDREILVTETLTHEMINAGRRLVEEMERAPNDGSVVRIIDAAFWLRETTEDFDRWNLVIAAPGISFEGPRKGYEWVSQAHSTVSSSPDAAVVPGDMIVVMDTNAQPIEALRELSRISAVHDQHLRGAVVGQRYFEELFIYRIDPVRNITCRLLDAEAMNGARREHHVYVFGEQLSHDIPFAIVAHGRLRMNGDANVVIALPVKYNIESGDDLECRPFIPVEATETNGTSRTSIRNVVLKRKHN